MQYLALCLYCRDENSYLEEWLEYHFSIGIDHVIIYDNSSFKPIKLTIKELGFAHKVTVLSDSNQEPGRVCLAYRNCLAEYSRAFKWIGFIDTDEFLVPKTTPNMASFLADYEHFASLGIFWYCFGSNGHHKRQPLITEAFTKRSGDGFHANAHIKSIVNTDFTAVVPPLDPHHFKFHPGFSCVDENETELRGPKGIHVSKKIQLNHYVLRSRDEWNEKMARGSPNHGKGKTIDFFKEYDAVCNRFCDDEILRIRRTSGAGKSKT